ncbi:MAG: hypothetical protein ABSE25_09370 [Syntrophorhabdales bacterium]
MKTLTRLASIVVLSNPLSKMAPIPTPFFLVPPAPCPAPVLTGMRRATARAMGMEQTPARKRMCQSTVSVSLPTSDAITAPTAKAL